MRFHPSRRTATGIIGFISTLAVASVNAQADPPVAHSTHAAADAPASSMDPAQIQRDLTRLREQVHQLEQRMQTSASGNMQQGGRTQGMRTQNKGSTSQMPSGMKMGGMRMMDDDMDIPKGDTEPGSMSMDRGERMSMDMMMGEDMMGMGAMGGAKSAAAMATPSALPGFPGQSHLYHIGATDFFLDHPEHITLTTQQQQRLAQVKQQSLIKQSELQRQIDAAEQDLWQLTGADEPQIGAIEKKAREVERLRGDKRVAFIRSVGEAAKVLSDEQRQQLTGMAPAQSTRDEASMPMPDNGKPKDNMGHM